ncbi:MAG: hypothetical protein ACNA8W_15835 [Bradymonadaceae bacterium]
MRVSIAALLPLLLGLSLIACGGEERRDSPPPNGADVGADASDPNGPDVGPRPGPDTSEPIDDEDRLEGVARTPAGFHVLPVYAASCEDPGGRVRIPFFYSSTDGYPIVRGDFVGGEMVWPNETLGIGTILADQARVALHSPFECLEDTDCQAPFRCASTGAAGAQKYCAMQSGVRLIPGTVRQDVDPGISPKRQLVSVLVQNTAGFDGRLPSRVGGLYDEDGERDLFANEDRATDPRLVHKSSLKEFFLQLRSMLDPDKTLVSLWWFSGDVGAETRPLTGEGLSDFFTDELDRLESIFDSMPGLVPRTANVWQSILRVLDRDFAHDHYDDDEKFLIVFTDRANEVYDEAATPEHVKAALEANNVKLLLFHLDSAVDPSTLRDLPTYWAGNTNCQDDAACAGAPTCSSGADCDHFEECRPATIYGTEATDTVQATPSSYCMPRYDDSGRLGPLDVYADIACHSGGHYFYFSEPDEMIPVWRTLAFMFNGQWSVEAELSALDTSASIPNGFYRLSGTLTGTLGPLDHGTNLSARISGRAGYDTRPLLRLGRLSGQ